MDLDLRIKLAIYHHFAATGRRPSAPELAGSLRMSPGEILDSFRRLQSLRVLVLDRDGESIRMAPPFSGVETQHIVDADGRSFYANCAWDAFGIPAAIRRPARVRSRCELSMEPLVLEIGPGGPPPSDWLFHCAVPAAHWWDDIVFT